MYYKRIPMTLTWNRSLLLLKTSREVRNLPILIFLPIVLGQINFEMSDEEVRPIIRRKIDESIISAFEVLRKRIDKFGVTQPNIQRLRTSGRILVELPGAKDVERVKNLLQSTAQLEFWETYKNEQFFAFLNQANEVVEIEASSAVAEEKSSILPSTIYWPM